MNLQKTKKKETLKNVSVKKYVKTVKILYETCRFPNSNESNRYPGESTKKKETLVNVSIKNKTKKW